MAASVQCRQQERSLRMVMKEKDDDLDLFLEMQSRETERNSLLLQSSDDFDEQIRTVHNSKQESSSISYRTSALPASQTAANELLSCENDRTDYDWLLTPPATPPCPSLEMKSKKTAMKQIGISNGRPVAPISVLDNQPAEPASRNNQTRELISTSVAANRRPSSSGGLKSSASRSATPTGRAMLPARAKSSRPSTPTSRATLPATTKPSRPSTPTSQARLTSVAKPSRAATPTSRATLPSTKPSAPTVRSSTPTRPVVRSSTPTARSSVPAASKSKPRSATPTNQSSTPSSVTSISGPPSYSSSVTKSGPKILKNQFPSRGTSPTVKSRPWKPSEMPGFSHDAPPNLKAPVPERPASTSRSRPGPNSAQYSSTVSSSIRRPRRQSCSPSRGQALNGSANNKGNSVLSLNRGHSIGGDDVNPVLIGTKMVERVVNMRKLAPPKHDDHLFKNSNSSGKSLSSQENSGFGRSLSKMSLDMALRHMDIRRVTNIPASSVYSVRSGSTKSRTASVLDSPLATSSNASSEPSINNNSHCLDGSELDENELGN